MKVEIIDAKSAPPPPGQVSGAAAEAADILGQLKKGTVAKIQPDDGQTIRGLRVNLGRAAKATGVKLITWEFDEILYVKLG